MVLRAVIQHEPLSFGSDENFIEKEVEGVEPSLSINYLLSKELLKGFKLLVQTSCEIFTCCKKSFVPIFQVLSFIYFLLVGVAVMVTLLLLDKYQTEI